MNQSFKPADFHGASPDAAEIELLSMQAARIIEAAMKLCGEHDLTALDSLLQARRSLSLIVDQRTQPLTLGKTTVNPLALAKKPSKLPPEPEAAIKSAAPAAQQPAGFASAGNNRR